MHQQTMDPETHKLPQRGFESHHGSPWTIFLTLPTPQIWRNWPLLPVGDSSERPARISLAPSYAFSQSFCTCPVAATDQGLSEGLPSLAYATDLSMSRTRASLDLISNSTALAHPSTLLFHAVSLTQDCQ